MSPPQAFLVQKESSFTFIWKRTKEDFGTCRIRYGKR